MLVERYIPCHDYRLLIVGDQLVAAARRDPPLVIGDGLHNIRQLVERVNLDPRRGEGHATSLTRIRLDEVALALLTSAGLNAESVPPRGQRVVPVSYTHLDVYKRQVRGMGDFFGRLQQAGRVYENNAPVYLRSHPLTVERISDMQNRADGSPYRQVADSCLLYTSRCV